jgi:uncharacterized protein (DUF433 family)
MPANTWADRIVLDPQVLSGKPIIKGTRISVELIVDLLGRGYSVEDVLKQYEHITREDVRACIAYAADVLKGERVYGIPA